MPSHQTPPSSVRATLVKIVSLKMEAMALGFVFSEVPGATPKNPYSEKIHFSLTNNLRNKQMKTKLKKRIQCNFKQMESSLNYAVLSLGYNTEVRFLIKVRQRKRFRATGQHAVRRHSIHKARFKSLTTNGFLR